MNKKDLYKKVVFRMNRKEIMEIFFEEQMIRISDDFDLMSKVWAMIDSMPDTVVLSFKFIMIEKLQKLAGVYLKEKRKEDFDRINKILIEVSGGQPDIMYDVGLEKMRNEDYEEAEPLFEEAFLAEFKNDVFDEDIIEIFDNFMICLANLGKYDKQIEMCGKILSEVDHKFVSLSLKRDLKMLALVNMGEALLEEFEYERALGVFMQAYLIDPTDPKPKLGLARYYDAINDFEMVKKLCKEVLDKYPENDFAWFQLGMAHIFSNERKEGARCLIKAYKIDPDNKYTQSNLLVCLGELGRIPVPTNCDEWDYFDELIESGEAHKIIHKIIKEEIESENLDRMKAKLEKMFGDG